MKNSILLYIKLIIYNSEFLYSGGNKFQLMMILQHAFNESTDFWLNSVWNNYKHFISLILAVAYFLSCDFEKLMLYVLSHVQCPHGNILNSVAICKLLCVFNQKLLHLQRLLHHQILIRGHCFNQCLTQTCFRTIKSEWVSRNWARMF